MSTSEATEIVSVNTDQVSTYLSTLFDPDDYVTFRPIETWTEEGKKKTRVLYKHVFSMPAYAAIDGVFARKCKEIASEHANPFVGVCPRQSGTGSFELAWQIQTVRCLWADLDGCTVDEALQRIREAGLPEPTMVVSSGNSAHIYWLLTEAILTGAPSFGVFQEWTEINGKKRPIRFFIVDGEKVWLDNMVTGKSIPANHPRLTEAAQRVQDTCQGIAAAIGGDHTQDLSCLLRVPGTMNRENERNGAEPKPCVLVKADFSLRYPFESFAEFADKAPSKKKRELIAKIPLPVTRPLTAPRSDTLNGKVVACATAADRSAADFSLCFWAIEKGVSQTEVWAACQNVGKFAERGESYFEAIWARAADHTREQRYEKSMRSELRVPVRPVAPSVDGEPPPEVERSYDCTDLNDIGNAQHYATTYKNELRYCAPWQKWLTWDGARWKIDDEGRPLKLAKELVNKMFSDAMELRGGQVFKHVCETAQLTRLKAMIALAGPELPIKIEELDQDGWILNCRNGVVDLTSGKIRPHDRTEGITKLCPTEFDLNSEAPAWNKFLRDVFVDDELIQFVQRLFGYFLTGDVSEQKLALFWGTGANGKSTLLNAFMDTIGPDYTMQCMPDFLMEKKSESHPTEKASLFGKRFVSCVETEASRKLAESTVKMLTGGEKIMARRMREDFWEFDPTHKLVLCTNHRPIISGTDHGIWRRLLLVPFLQRFDGERQDKHLPEKLKAERAGILAWAVRGCLEWQRIGLNPPPCVCSATEDYRSSEDIFGRFIADCCVVNKSTAVKFAELYERFEKWADDAGEFLPSKRVVGAWLEENGFEKYSANGRWYRGLILRKTEQTEDVEKGFTKF